MLGVMAELDPFAEIIDEMIKEGSSYLQISHFLSHQGVVKCSERTIRRFCGERGISKRSGTLTDDAVADAVAEAVGKVGPTYGRKMMTGHLAAEGIRVSEGRVGQALRSVNVPYHRERQQGARNLNPVPYYAAYHGDKLHMDQNEKLAMFGVTHVLALDGYSRQIVGHSTMEIKNNLKIYEEVFRPAVFRDGIWNQVRVDRGKEFHLCLYVQEINTDKRRNTAKPPYRQTPSTQNHMVERIWPEVNNRVNYPIKAALVELVNRDDLDMSDNIDRFCTSSLAGRLCTIGIDRMVAAWNAHAIPNRGIPNQMAGSKMNGPVSAEDLPPAHIATQMYLRDTGTQLKEESSFSSYPFPNPVAEAECTTQFNQEYPAIMDLLDSAVNRQVRYLQEALLLLIELTKRYS